MKSSRLTISSRDLGEYMNQFNERPVFSIECCRDVAQKCFCGSSNCRGYLGRSKQTQTASSNPKVLSQHIDQGFPHSPSTRRRGRHRLQSNADSVVSAGNGSDGSDNVVL